MFVVTIACLFVVISAAFVYVIRVCIHRNREWMGRKKR